MRYHIDRAPHGIVFALSLSDLFNNHKFNFNGVNVGGGRTRNTFLDWFLVPKERPSIEKAPVKEHYIDIPGANGGLDLSESLTGSPVYDYAEGDIEFTILNDRVIPILNNDGEVTKEVSVNWEVLNRDIRNFLNGKKMYMMLEDDPSWYYYGRFGVEKYDSSEASNSKIKINYKVYPYKRLTLYDSSSDIYRNMYFDSYPLFDSDTKSLFSSFWRRTSVELYPNNPLTVSFNGETPNDLPCGDENVTVTFGVQKLSKAFIPKIKYYKYGEDGSAVDTIEAYLNTEVSSKIETTKVRGVALTNKYSRWDNRSAYNHILFSDNAITLSTTYPAAFDLTKSYKKDDVVSYISYQENIKWILKAKEDITPTGEETDIDITKWDVDELAMNYKKYSSSQKYVKNDIVYVINDEEWPNKVVLVKATTAVDRVPFNADNWTTDVGTLTLSDLYSPVKVSIIYDIGVM